MTSDDDHFGAITPNGGGFDLRFERRIAASVERVWAAITIPERISSWFAEARVQIEPRLGGAYNLRFGDEGPFTEGKITAFDPPWLLEHTWPDPPNPPARVRYELEPDGDGCRLRLTNFGVPAAYIGSLAGWHIFLDAVEPSIGGAQVSWSMEAERDLMAIYKERMPWLKDVTDPNSD